VVAVDRLMTDIPRVLVDQVAVVLVMAGQQAV
jgi:hypothetical protein